MCGACRAVLLVASFAAASSFALFVPYFALGQLALFAIQVSHTARQASKPSSHSTLTA